MARARRLCSRTPFSDVPNVMLRQPTVCNKKTVKLAREVYNGCIEAQTLPTSFLGVRCNHGGNLKDRSKLLDSEASRWNLRGTLVLRLEGQGFGSRIDGCEVYGFQDGFGGPLDYNYTSEPLKQ